MLIQESYHDVPTKAGGEGTMREYLPTADVSASFASTHCILCSIDSPCLLTPLVHV